MKKVVLIIAAISLLIKGFSQNEKILPVITIKEVGSWSSGIEARGIYFDSKILDAMYTMLSNSSEVDSVKKTISYLTYLTPYKDRVFFILSPNPLQSRVLLISRIPMNSLGVILRLDNEMLQAAHYFSSCVEGKEQDVFNIFAGNKGKFYYSTQKGQYCRVYLDQTDDLSNIATKSGYLVIPANASMFSFRYGEYKGRDASRSYNVNLKFQDNVVASYTFSTDAQGFNLGLIYSENKPAGTYRYKVEINSTIHMGVRGPNERFRLWFDCFGNDLTEPVSIDGNPQPFLISRAFNEILLPK
jgi:hypothetical protein